MQNNKMFNFELFASNLLFLFDKFKISKSKFEEDQNLTRGYITRLLKNKSVPGTNLLLLISNYFSFTIDKLIYTDLSKLGDQDLFLSRLFTSLIGTDLVSWLNFDIDKDKIVFERFDADSYFKNEELLKNEFIQKMPKYISKDSKGNDIVSTINSNIYGNYAIIEDIFCIELKHYGSKMLIVKQKRFVNHKYNDNVPNETITIYSYNDREFDDSCDDYVPPFYRICDTYSNPYIKDEIQRLYEYSKNIEETNNDITNDVMQFLNELPVYDL